MRVEMPLLIRTGAFGWALYWESVTLHVYNGLEYSLIRRYIDVEASKWCVTGFPIFAEMHTVLVCVYPHINMSP